MKYIRLETAGSTNSEAFHYLDRFDPVTVIAHSQKGGRGRGENRWESPPGNIYLSVGKTLRTHALPGLSIRIAVHVVQNLNRVLREDLRIKWPNDLYSRDKKAGGILTETKIKGNRASVVAGIGLNLAVAPLNSSTILPVRDGVHRDSLELLLVKAILAAFSDTNSIVFVKTLSELSWFRPGDQIRFLENGSPVEAVFERYNETLAMVVRCKDEIRSITASEVSRLRKAGC